MTSIEQHEAIRKAKQQAGETFDLVERLNELLQMNENGIEGYKTAAGAVKHADYALMFRSFIEQRESMATDLRELVKAHGGEVADSGTFGGAMHRAWINLKSAVFTDDASIITECLRGEKAALEAYDDFLALDHLPPSVQQSVRLQKEGIERMEERLTVIKTALSS